MNKKVILAFSGGLDTCFCVLYLTEKGYDVVTATINTGGFSKEDLENTKKTALKYGASKHYNIDVQDEIYESIISYIIKLNAKYQEDYPLMCADRYVISEKLVEIAKKESAQAIAHGSTSNGNDQVRFDASLLTLDSNFEILTPIKALNITREEEIDYIQKKGFEVQAESKKYSINHNVFGTTLSGSEIDKNLEPDEKAYILTKKTAINSQPEYINLHFEKGLPTKLNDKKMSGLEILKRLEKMAGKYGYGSEIYSGDCIIGIKGRILFESPGLLLLIEAHRKMEQYVLSKQQIKFNKWASEFWTDLVYSGLYYEPLRENIEAYSDDNQKFVNGLAKIKLETHRATVVEIQSENTLINESICTYAQKGSWGETEANGFIKLYSMQQNMAHRRK